MSQSKYIDEYFGHLVGEGRSPGVDADSLSTMSKTAARNYIQSRVPLNESIVKIANDEGNLNAEHIKRIVEMANTEVFQHLFKTAGKDNKYIHFEIADPGIVLDTLNVVEKTASYDLSSYYSAPSKRTSNLEKTATMNSLADELNSNPATLRHANPDQDVFELDEKLKLVKEELQGDRENAVYKMKMAYDELYSSIKEELGENSFKDIVGAMSSVSNDLSVLEPIGYQLMKEKAASFDQLNINFKTKMAKVMPNPEHPIVYYFSEYTKLANKKDELDEAINIVDEQLAQTKSYIKQASFKETAKDLGKEFLANTAAVGGTLGGMALGRGLTEGRGSVAKGVASSVLGLGIGMSAGVGSRKLLGLKDRRHET